MEDNRDKEIARKDSNPVYFIIDRFALGPIWRKVLARRVPQSRWYYGDGATLFALLFILIMTGIALSFLYSPSPASAYESVVKITQHVFLGSFVRALHYWAAGMMLIVLLYHLFRHLLLGGYLPPREGTWIMGMLMAILIVVNSFLGYALRFDERAVYAWRVALHILNRIPWIGDEIVLLVQGDWTQGEALLSRFYSLHTIAIPLGLLALAGYHMYLVLYHGVTTVPERVNPVETSAEHKELYDHLKNHPKHGTHFFPHVLAGSQTFAFIVILITLGLAYFIGPAELMPKGNYHTTSQPREEWWFHWFSAAAAYTPPWMTDFVYLWLPLIALLMFFVIPFVDRGANRGLRRRPLALGFVLLSIISLVTLTGLRFESPWTAWPTEHLAPLPEGKEFSPNAELGHSLFTRYGCLNCHAVGTIGGKFGPRITELDRKMSFEELKNYIARPPEDVAMPAYGERLSPEELSALAEFVLAAQTFPRAYE